MRAALSFANGITAVRLFGSLGIPVYVYLRWPLEVDARFGLLLALLLLGSTDLIDGWVARMAGQVTDFGKYFDPVADFVFCVCLLLSHQIIWWGHPISWLGLMFASYFFLYGYSVSHLRQIGILSAPDQWAKAGMFCLMLGLILAFGSSLFPPLRNWGHAAAIAFLLAAVVMTLHSLEKSEKKTEPRH